MADYKIELGVSLDTNDIQSQVNEASNKIKPIDIKVDAETKELTKTINDALKSLSNGSKNALTLDTSKLEASLNDVTSTIKEIKMAMGTLDSGSGMKSLVGSINSISTALDKASDKFDELLADLKSLSGKDFNINFGINMGGSNPIGRNAAYGNKVRTDTLPQLKQQMSDLVKYYNTTYNESLNEFEALQKMVSGTKLNTGDFFENFLFGKNSVASRMSGGSLASQMQAYKEYINMFKEAAKLKGLDLNGVTSGFSKSADELIKDAEDIQTGAKEMEDSFEKLKQVFGGGNNLNVEGISQQLDSIVVDLNEIKTALQGLSSGVSLEGLTQSFDRLSETIEQLVKNCTTVKQAINDSVSNVEKSVGQGSGETVIKETSNELKKLKDLARQIGQLDFKIVKSDYNDEINQVREFERQLELLKTQYNTTLKSLSGQDIDIGSGITKEFAEARSKIAEFEAKVVDTKRKLAEDIKTNIGTNISKNISKVHSDFNNLSIKTTELQQKLDLLDNIKIDLDTAAANNDIDGLIAANERYEKVLKEVNTQLDINKRAQRDASKADALRQNTQNLSLEMDNWLRDNSAAAKEFGASIRELQARLKSCDNVEFNNIKGEFKQIQLEAKATGKAGMTTFDKLKTKFKEYSTYLSAAEVFMWVEQGLRSMFEQVKLIDSAMTELKKVTNETDSAYNEFLSNAATRSKEIGTTIDGLVSSTADFARLGYGFKDSQGLAEVANIYAVVGDEINGVEGATESLISTMAAFKGEMNGMSDADFAMSIIDKFNEIGNNFAISSGGIGEAMKRSASSLMAANNTIDESIALITAANTVVVLCHAA